jgi:hypothetical protein
MTHTHATGQDEHLDQVLCSLSPDVEPARDLWPYIESRLEQPASATPGNPSRRTWLWQAAAAVLLVGGSSLLTAIVVKRGQEAPLAQQAPAAATVHATPAVFGPVQARSAEYEVAREQLSAMLQLKLANMPSSARYKLEANLAEMQRAAAEIGAALDQRPGDPLLEELLLNTYHDQLTMLAVVNQLTSTNVTATPATATRMQL